MPSGRAAKREFGGRRFPQSILAGEEAAAEGTVGDDADTVRLRHWHHVLLDSPIYETVPRLFYDPGGKSVALRQPEAVHNLPRCKVRSADIAHFALLHQVVHGADGLFEGRGWIRDVEVVYVDVVGLQTPQRTLCSEPISRQMW